MRIAALTLLAALGFPALAATDTKLELGAEERVRSESWSDIVDHDAAVNDARTQYRFRTRAWGKVSFGTRADLAISLTNESRKIARPDTPYKWDEVVFDTLSVNWRFDDRVNARLGRQNFLRGEGFVFADGSALDGSRTAYFNALDVSILFGTSTLELVAISDPLYDTYLPRFNENAYGPKKLNEWDEAAAGLYYTNRDLKRATIEAYLFRKTETGDVRAATSASFQPDRAVNILGSRVMNAFGAGWTATAEAAYEWGRQDANAARGTPEADISAWGGYATVKKAFAKGSIQAGWIAMSGDDPATGRIEGWDPLFARWPKYSELYIYSQSVEKGVAYWTNLSLWQLEGRLEPVKDLTLRATYYRMGAFHAFAGSPATFGTGTNRGDLWQARADLVFAPHWKLHALYEHLAPGDFYVHRDAGYFLRFEVMYTGILN